MPIAAQYMRRACLSSSSASAGVRYVFGSKPCSSNSARRSGSLNSSYAAPISLNRDSAASLSSAVRALSG